MCDQIKDADETKLAFVAALSRGAMRRSWIMDRMGCRCAIACGDRLRASYMQRRLTGYLGAKAKSYTAVTASFVRHRAHGVALGVIAGSAAWTPGYSGSGNNDDTHVFTLDVSSAATRNSNLPSKIRTTN
jgi:hypothetical protein